MGGKERRGKELAEEKRRMETMEQNNKIVQEDLQKRLKALTAQHDITKILHGSTIVQRDASRKRTVEQTARAEVAEKVKDTDAKLAAANEGFAE